MIKKLAHADLAARYKVAIEAAGGVCCIEEHGSDATTDVEVVALAKPSVSSLPATPLAASVAVSQKAISETYQSGLKGKGRLAAMSRRATLEARKFLLLDAPERVIPLKFALPAASVRAKVGSASSVELFNTEDDPLEYFKLLHARIKFLNFAKLGVSARLRANRDLLKMFYPMAIKHMVDLAKTGGIPESEERRQLLILTSEIANILIISSAFIFADYYEGSKFHYARNRHKLLEVASRIFELLLVKQRARALRYQPLDASDWSIANTIFYVLRTYEDVEQPRSTLMSELKMDGLKADKSLSDHFILLQIFAWFDLLRLPTHLQWVIGSYLLQVENAVQIKDDANSLASNELLIYCYGKQPAEIRRLSAPPGPAVILNLQNLIEAMREDCLATGSSHSRDGSQVMPRFAHFEAADHFVIRNQLLNRLNPQAESRSLSEEHQVNDLRIFVGFSAIFAMLRHRKGEFGSEDRLEDRLSKRSAVFVNDGNETRKSLWSFSFQSEDMTRFTTTEGPETTAMGIGMLLAYGEGDEVNRPRLAVVSRILRPHGRLLELDMRFIARFSEPVILSFNTVKVPGLAVYDPRKGGHWALAFPPRDVLIGVDNVEIHRNKTIITVELKAILDASNDFYLVDTTLTSSQLGFSGEPQYPAATAKKSVPRIF